MFFSDSYPRYFHGSYHLDCLVRVVVPVHAKCFETTTSILSVPLPACDIRSACFYSFPKFLVPILIWFVHYPIPLPTVFDFVLKIGDISPQ